MKNSVLNRYKSVFAMLLMLVAVAFAGCITDEETEVTPECYITGLTVKDIKSAYHQPAYDGSDSVTYRTISGGTIKFHIDQLKGVITSVDSLPNWTDLTEVYPTFSYTGVIFARKKAYMGDDMYYAFNNGTDSVNFTHPVEFMVVGSDGISTKHYWVSINKSSIASDSLVWADVKDHNLSLTDNSQLIVKNGQFYAFTDESGTLKVSTSANAKDWTTPATLTGFAKPIDIQSVCIFKDSFYALGADGQIYSSAEGTAWTAASAEKAVKLLGADKYYIYIFDGTNILASKDLTNWEVNGDKDIEMIPETNISLISYATKTNTALQASVLTGLTSKNTNAATVWYKISADDELTNQSWNYIKVTSENPYPLPYLEGLEVFPFEGELYAMGAGNSVFYRSSDNGITWIKLTRHILPPAAVEAGNHANAVEKDGYIWMAQRLADGSTAVWKGRVNKK
ncbi:MAG: DUF6242 domain-containing protein [Bacteroidaceae bacterium]|nr:DUF6242 domain-containing protein [Bacteroidaceae bacterium]